MLTDVGYAQGMNDIMSRFFVVMDSEADAYWMFCNYMEHFKGDFMESDMLRKISKFQSQLHSNVFGTIMHVLYKAMINSMGPKTDPWETPNNSL